MKTLWHKDSSQNRNFLFKCARWSVLAGAGAGTLLTARAQHLFVGEETHTQTIAEMPAHTHGMYYATTSTGGSNANQTSSGGLNVPTTSTGGSAGFNVLQPTVCEHLLISAGAR